MIKRQPVSKIVMKNRVRSIFALILSVVIFVFVLASVVIGLLTTPSTITPERGSRVFMLFTVNSNLVAAAGAICVVPYAIDGLRNRWHRLPKWVDRLLYCGTLSVNMTLVFAMAILYPRMGNVAVTGMNLGLHVVCPILTIILFICVENSRKLTYSDSLLSLIPYFLYATVYFLMVVALKKWRDIYGLVERLGPIGAIAAMTFFALALSAVLRIVHNYLSIMGSKRISKDLISVENINEYYTLEEAINQLASFYVKDSSEMIVPLDLIREMTLIYKGLTFEEAVKDYVEAFLKKAEEYK
ncbi:MAG: hypothetical protein ACI4SL_10415 [Candidatus Ornithospirochaeta sp.]